MLEINDLKKTFENGSPALKGVNLKINKGDNICILGQSGSGKTTLVKIICGLIKPHSGNIKIDGENIVKYASFNNNPKNIFENPENQNILFYHYF